MGHVDTYYVDLTQDDPVLNEDADWKIFSCQLQVPGITQVLKCCQDPKTVFRIVELCPLISI